MTRREKGLEIRIVYVCVILFFAFFLLFPAAIILFKSVESKNGLTFSHFVSVFSAHDIWKAFSNSCWVSSLAALITTILAFIPAYTVNFTNIPMRLKKIIRTAAVFPMLLPTITYGFAIIYSFGRQGLLTKLFGRQLFDFYGFTGLLLGYVIYTLPVSFVLLNNTMSYVDKRFLTVTHIMGDSPFSSFCTAVFRPLLGTFAASFVQCFFLAFTDFGIPASVGGRFTVIASLLYNIMIGTIPDFNNGSVVAIFMLLPSVISVIFLEYLQRFNVRYNKITVMDMRTNHVRDAVWTLFSAVILVSILSIFAVVFVLPFAAEWPYRLDFTFDHVVSVFQDKSLRGVFINSLVISLLTAVFGTILVYCSALVTARSNLTKKSRGLIEMMAQITNAVPGMVLGVAFLLAFKKTPLHNSLAIIIICNLVHFFATPYLMMRSSLDKLNASWETTARLMGDSWIKTVVRIITPNSISTLFEVFCYFFINGMVTVSAIVFIARARTMVITTKIKELQFFAKFNEIFVLSVLILLTNLVLKLIKGILNAKKR